MEAVKYTDKACLSGHTIGMSREGCPTSWNPRQVVLVGSSTNTRGGSGALSTLMLIGCASFAFFGWAWAQGLALRSIMTLIAFYVRLLRVRGWLQACVGQASGARRVGGWLSSFLTLTLTLTLTLSPNPHLEVAVRAIQHQTKAELAEQLRGGAFVESRPPCM